MEFLRVIAQPQRHKVIQKRSLPILWRCALSITSARGALWQACRNVDGNFVQPRAAITSGSGMRPGLSW
jgi:hypothetical protein